MFMTFRQTGAKQWKIRPLVKMVPQLYITMYKEQFASPGEAKRAHLRPTSAHRRNNPQPRPDFLFPWSLQPSYRSPRMQPHPSPPVDIGRPLLPPVRHVSFHSPLMIYPGNNTVDMNKPQHMPPVNPATEQALPSADRLPKLQLTEPPAGAEIQLHTALKTPERTMDFQRNVNRLSEQQLRQHASAQLRTRPQTTNGSAASHHFSGSQYRSGCCSCFHVVKPYQAGHYIIHPEFVSECQW